MKKLKWSSSANATLGGRKTNYFRKNFTQKYYFKEYNDFFVLG
jgi:hypothetical protein